MRASSDSGLNHSQPPLPAIMPQGCGGGAQRSAAASSPAISRAAGACIQIGRELWHMHFPHCSSCNLPVGPKPRMQDCAAPEQGKDAGMHAGRQAGSLRA